MCSMACSMAKRLVSTSPRQGGRIAAAQIPRPPRSSRCNLVPPLHQLRPVRDIVCRNTTADSQKFSWLICHGRMWLRAGPFRAGFANREFTPPALRNGAGAVPVRLYFTSPRRTFPRDNRGLFEDVGSTGRAPPAIAGRASPLTMMNRYVLCPDRPKRAVRVVRGALSPCDTSST